jgi:hypothetical protein
MTIAGFARKTDKMAKWQKMLSSSGKNFFQLVRCVLACLRTVVCYCLEATQLPTMTTQSSSLRFADQAAKSPYSFPGGYPKFAVTSDGACLCPSCCKTERELIATTTGDDGWNVIGIDLNFEDDHLFCDHCSGKIESAYGA